VSLAAEGSPNGHYDLSGMPLPSLAWQARHSR
jgi:hypothetical protein